MINIKINNKNFEVPERTTILKAAEAAGFDIPTLCYLEDINCIGACRVCVVEVKNARSLVTACNTTVSPNMEVTTFSERIRKSRKATLELILSDHDRRCTSCPRSENCEFRKLCFEYGCSDSEYAGYERKYTPDASAGTVVRYNNKCILCRRCVAACNKIQSVGVIGANKRGFNTYIGCAFNDLLSQTNCVNCGQCINACPTGALSEYGATEEFFAAASEKNNRIIAITAPSVRVALGEEFGLPAGTNVEGKMVAALRRLGAVEVFDVDLGADLTIMEEGAEFLQRLKNNGVLPMVTSCSPGWVKFAEHNYPELLGNLSSCKSPQQMLGAVIKTYYAQKIGIDPKTIKVVSIMPCTAKKFERARPKQDAAGVPDIDIVLTTRELARCVRNAGIIFDALPNERFDSPLGLSSSAGLIFGASGGVMEAALRTLKEIVDGTQAKALEFAKVRGFTSVKNAEVDLGGKKIRVAVVSGLAEARKLMDEVRERASPYHFIEVMACPGGCINGGGQPIITAKTRSKDILKSRSAAIYKADKASELRKSHLNPVIQTLYKEFFGSPGSRKAHEILHTEYIKR